MCCTRGLIKNAAPCWRWVEGEFERCPVGFVWKGGGGGCAISFVLAQFWRRMAQGISIEGRLNYSWVYKKRNESVMRSFASLEKVF